MTLFVLLLIIGAFVLLVSPFVYDFGFRIYEKSSVNIDRYADLFIRKESLLSALSDLNQDNEAGKLLSEDFQSTRTEIIGELKSIDAQLNDEKLDLQEPAPQAAAGSRAKVAGATATESGANTELSRFCHNCGFEMKAAYKFCPKCGTEAVAVQ